MYIHRAKRDIKIYCTFLINLCTLTVGFVFSGVLWWGDPTLFLPPFISVCVFVYTHNI